jgi:DNA-binding transcriptional ArsR family regulator
MAHMILRGAFSLLRIRFTGRDVEKLKMVSTLGPVAEGLFALDLFGRRRGVGASGWRRQVRHQLGPDLAEVQLINRDYQAVPDLLWLMGSDHAGPATEAEARRLAAVAFGFCRAAVLPYWSRVRAQLEAERDVRGRMVITNGVETLLMALHPKAVWHSPVLEIASELDRDIELHGDGVLLAPSLFLADEQCVFLESERQTGMPALIFSVPADIGELVGLAEEPDVGDRALGALVGATRAAALRALSESGTTGELADRLGISLSGASKHATVLREAGLISTQRNRTTARHTLTPLGAALLRPHTPTADQPALSSSGCPA